MTDLIQFYISLTFKSLNNALSVINMALQKIAINCKPDTIVWLQTAKIKKDQTQNRYDNNIYKVLYIT